MNAHQARAWGAFIAVGLLLFVAIAAPTVALLYTWTANEDATAATDEAALYPLDQSPRSVTVNATAVPSWHDGTSLRAPAWDGLVTGLPVSVGDSIESGETVAYVNGIDVRFYQLGTPIFQPVCSSDTVLVPEVRSILQSAGFTVGISSSVGWTDVKAIRAYARLIGAPDATRTTCFDPGWVVSAPQGIAEVGEIALAVGALAPQVGEE